MKDNTLSGCVTRYRSGFYSVQTGQETITCRLRGRLKNKSTGGDLVAVGDQVQISLQEDGSGVIEAVLPRRSALVRSAPLDWGDYQQVLVANLDQVALIFACSEPDPRLPMLDRLLVICERQNLPPLIVANKIDLVGEEKARAIFSIYPSLGYSLILTAAPAGRGIDELRRAVRGKLTGFIGPSGVGKTSLLNALQPNLGLNVRSISQATSKGRHTTVVREMFALEEGGYVADLPGLRSLTFWDIEPEELDGYFPELRPLVADCQFSDCNHHNTPGCAVLKAVDEGRVHRERYKSYLRMRFGGDE